MKIVSSTSDADVAERRARQALEWPLREATANILRVSRGSGRPAAVASLMLRAVEAFSAYRDATGTYPASHTIAEILAVSKTASLEAWRASFPTGTDDSDFERWMADGSFDREGAVDDIIRAALQISASRLLKQRTQETCGGHDLFEAVRELESIKEKLRRATYKPR